MQSTHNRAPRDPLPQRPARYAGHDARNNANRCLHYAQFNRGFLLPMLVVCIALALLLGHPGMH